MSTKVFSSSQSNPADCALFLPAWPSEPLNNYEKKEHTALLLSQELALMYHFQSMLTIALYVTAYSFPRWET